MRNALALRLAPIGCKTVVNAGIQPRDCSFVRSALEVFEGAWTPTTIVVRVVGKRGVCAKDLVQHGRSGAGLHRVAGRVVGERRRGHQGWCPIAVDHYLRIGHRAQDVELVLGVPRRHKCIGHGNIELHKRLCSAGQIGFARFEQVVGNVGPVSGRSGRLGRIVCPVQGELPLLLRRGIADFVDLQAIFVKRGGRVFRVRRGQGRRAIGSRLHDEGAVLPPVRQKRRSKRGGRSRPFARSAGRHVVSPRATQRAPGFMPAIGACPSHDGHAHELAERFRAVGNIRRHRVGVKVLRVFERQAALQQVHACLILGRRVAEHHACHGGHGGVSHRRPVQRLIGLRPRQGAEVIELPGQALVSRHAGHHGLVKRQAHIAQRARSHRRTESGRELNKLQVQRHPVVHHAGAVGGRRLGHGRLCPCWRSNQGRACKKCCAECSPGNCFFHGAFQAATPVSLSTR